MIEGISKKSNIWLVLFDMARKVHGTKKMLSPKRKNVDRRKKEETTMKERERLIRE
jgi:hypothetical protein